MITFLLWLLKWALILFSLLCVSVISIIFICLRPSKEELLRRQVMDGNIQGIKASWRNGARLESVDFEGKTPLILACSDSNLYAVARTLIELGANVNTYRPGVHAGTPLHHAARLGLEPTVKLLLSHGGSLVFILWLAEESLPGFLDLLAPQLFSRKVWVVVSPCGSRNIGEPSDLELAIYADEQDARPQKIIPLRYAKIQEPNFDLPDPVAIIINSSKGQRIKLGPVQESEKQQLQRLCNACRGLAFPQVSNVEATAPPSDDEQLAMAINTSLQFAEQQRYASQVESSSSSACSSNIIPSHDARYTTDTSTSHNASTTINERIPIDLPVGNISDPALQKKQDGGASSCTICLDASVEGACIPCGHMAGCMSCLNEIKTKKWGCPICRAKIDQVIRLYAV